MNCEATVSLRGEVSGAAFLAVVGPLLTAIMIAINMLHRG